MAPPKPATSFHSMHIRYLRLLNSGLFCGYTCPLLAVKNCFGVQAQEANAGFISIWNRLNSNQISSTIESMRSLVDVENDLVHVWGCRGTLHFYHPEHWDVVNACIKNKLFKAMYSRIDRLNHREKFEKEVVDARKKLDYHSVDSPILISTSLKYFVKMAITLNGHGLRVGINSRAVSLCSRRHTKIDVIEINEENALIEAGKVYFKAFGPATTNDFKFWLGIKSKPSKDTVTALVQCGYLTKITTHTDDKLLMLKQSSTRDVKKEDKQTEEDYEVKCKSLKRKARSTRRNKNKNKSLKTMKPRLLECREMDEWVEKNQDTYIVTSQLEKYHTNEKLLNPIDWPVKLLGRFETTILAHSDKRWLIEEQFRKLVWGKSAQVFATVLIQGRICGTWKHKIVGGKEQVLTVFITSFDSEEFYMTFRNKEIQKKIEIEVLSLQTFLCAKKNEIVYTNL